MAEIVHSLKVKIEPETIQEIKQALYKEIAEVVEEAYGEGWLDGQGLNERYSTKEECWQNSEIKKKLDNFGK